MSVFEGTTICAVLKDGTCAIAGDGQITMGEKVILKNTAIKVRRIFEGKVILGFAGSVADALALSEKFESALEQFNGNLTRAAVELARAWRGDKALRKLEAMMLVSDGKELLLVSGTGEVIEPEGGLCAIGSGGNYAYAAARAMVQHTQLAPADIARQAVGIAADICVFTNHNIIVEEVSAC